MDQNNELLLANLILPLIKDLILPKIETVLLKHKDKSQIDKSDIAIVFERYLHNKYTKYSIIDTLTFPNKQTLFEVLYEPLTLVLETKVGDNIKYLINKFPKDLFSDYYRIIIEDTAGMGKSTILIKMFRAAIEEKIGIPFLIPLRKINNQNSLVKEINKQINPTGNTLPDEVINDLLKQGIFTFLLDGFDEISNSDREFVLNDLKTFIETFKDNFFLISSRPETSLISFGDFQKFHVKPLDKHEAYKLVERYDYYSYQPIALPLITQLEENKNQSLNEYLSNPFLVSLLYKSFDYRKDIPLKKSQFYRQVYDALFEAHDLSKEGYLKRDKYSKLHSDDFERVIRHIGYLTSIENKVEYEIDYILNIINKTKKFVSDLNFKSSDFLKDLLETVPLFKRDGNYVKWAHKSLQDYFSSKFIWIDSKDTKVKILNKIYNDKDNPRFSLVLELYYELDPTGFESTILLWFLEDFKKHNDSYKDLGHIDRKLLIKRIENTFIVEFKVIKTRSKDADRSVNRKFNLSDTALVLPKEMKNTDYILLCVYNVKENFYTIMTVLETKMPRLVGHRKFQESSQDLDIPHDTLISVDSNKDNILNDPKNFEFINKSLTLRVYPVHKEFLRKLDSIKLKLDTANNDDLTDW